MKHIHSLILSIAIIGLMITPANAQDVWPPSDDIVADTGRMETMVLERFRDGVWEDSKKEEYLYDDNGLLVQKIFSSINNSEWRVTRRESYAYEDVRLVTVLKEDKRGKMFHASAQRTFMYADGRVSAMTIDAFGPNAQVIPVFANEYSYEESDSSLTTKIVQSQNVDEEWVMRKTLVYTSGKNGLLADAVKIQNRDGTEQVTERYHFAYNEEGQLIDKTWDFLSEDGWMSPFSVEISFEDGRSIIESSQTLQGVTQKSGKVILVYSETGNVSSRTFQMYRGDEYVSARRENYEYDEL